MCENGKDKIASVRFSGQEKERYSALAKIMGISLSSLIRNLLENEYNNKINILK